MSHQAVHESEFQKHAVKEGQVLFVCTNVDKLKDIPTGAWLSEVAEPFYVFEDAGYDVTLCTPKGGPIPIDPASLEGDFLTEEAKRVQQDDAAQQQLKASVALSTITEPSSYDLIFLPGGHGPMLDLAQDDQLGGLITDMYAAGKVVAAVCHGPAGLVKAKDGERPLVAGKKVTGFTNTEEEAVGKTSMVPFLLEDKLKELGGEFGRGDADWGPHVVSDGRLVTGQNPGSSTQVAKVALQLLESTKAGKEST